MKLFIPKQFSMVTEAKEDEHVLDMDDALILQEIMTNFDSFQELARAVGKFITTANVSLRYKVNFAGMPVGSMGDYFRTVVNIFGDVGMEENYGKFPARLAKDRLAALMAEEMSISERTAHARLKVMMHAGYFKLEAGYIMFPVDMVVR